MLGPAAGGWRIATGTNVVGTTPALKTSSRWLTTRQCCRVRGEGPFSFFLFGISARAAFRKQKMYNVGEWCKQNAQDMLVLARDGTEFVVPDLVLALASPFLQTCLGLELDRRRGMRVLQLDYSQLVLSIVFEHIETRHAAVAAACQRDHIEALELTLATNEVKLSASMCLEVLDAAQKLDLPALVSLQAETFLSALAQSIHEGADDGALDTQRLILARLFSYGRYDVVLELYSKLLVDLALFGDILKPQIVSQQGMSALIDYLYGMPSTQSALFAVRWARKLGGSLLEGLAMLAAMELKGPPLSARLLPGRGRASCCSTSGTMVFTMTKVKDLLQVGIKPELLGYVKLSVLGEAGQEIPGAWQHDSLVCRLPQDHEDLTVTVHCCLGLEWLLAPLISDILPTLQSYNERRSFVERLPASYLVDACSSFEVFQTFAADRDAFSRWQARWNTARTSSAEKRR